MFRIDNLFIGSLSGQDYRKGTWLLMTLHQRIKVWTGVPKIIHESDWIKRTKQIGTTGSMVPE